MNRLMFSVFFFLFFIPITIFSEDKELVIQFDLDKESYNKLSDTEKAYADSALATLVQNITAVSGITGTNDKVTAQLREIQKKSQIEAGNGLRSESAAYSTEVNTIAELRMNLLVQKLDDKYRLNCIISDIQSTKIIGQSSQKDILLSEIDSTGIDKLSADLLEKLTAKKGVPVDYEYIAQLKHEKNTAENLRAYIDNYTKQEEDAKSELAELKAKNKTQEQSLDAELEIHAAQMRIEFAAKKRKQAEENLRIVQNAQNTKAKQQQAFDAMNKGQQVKFQSDMKELEKMQKEIYAESLKSVSLKKRIELITTAQNNLTYLKTQLEQGVSESNVFYDNLMNQDVDAKKNEPWKKADLSNGEPTAIAIKVRQVEISSIQKDYTDKKSDAEMKLRSAVQPDIEDAESRINESLKDLQSTVFVFTSVDTQSNYLSLNVDEFDANTYSWKVHSRFQTTDIQKMDDGTFVLPDIEVSYKMMTGKDIPDSKNVSRGADDTVIKEYKEYQDAVDYADIYFRMSQPYLYAEVTTMVVYNTVTDSYSLKFQHFTVNKTENRKSIYILDEKEYTKNQLRVEKKQSEQAAEEEAKRIALEKEEERDERARLRKQKTENLWNNFLNTQHSRTGMYLEGEYNRGNFFQGGGGDLQFLFGSSNRFGGFEVEMCGVSVNDGYTAEYDGFSSISASVLVGISLNLGRHIMPYAGVGIGYGSMFKYLSNENSNETSSSYSSSTNDDPSSKGLCEGFVYTAEAGCEIRNRALALGGFYKLRYFSGAGFIDTYGATIGIYWGN